jgi:predicted nucleotidyltransferase
MDAYAARLLTDRAEIEEIVVFGSFAEGNSTCRVSQRRLAS